jgi:thymidine kinase
MDLINTTEYINARLIVIDEGQFFEDIVEFVKRVVDIDGKNCIVVGLDGDAQRKPFGHILEIIPLSNKVTKLTSMCAYCKDGTPAIFTLAIDNTTVETIDNGDVCVGGADKYVPVCRNHYLSGGIDKPMQQQMPIINTDLIGRI